MATKKKKTFLDAYNNTNTSQQLLTVARPADTIKANLSVSATKKKTEEKKTKTEQMAENSKKWNQLELQKNIPTSDKAQLTQKQQALHQQNVKLAGNSLKFSNDGTWKNPISSQQAYDAGTVKGGKPQILPPLKTLQNFNATLEQTPLQKAEMQKAQSVKQTHDKAMQQLSFAGDFLNKNTWAGITSASSGITKTVDLFLPDFLTPKPLQDYLNWNSDYADQQKAKASEVNSKGGKLTQIGGEIYQAGVGMLPQAITALASGGTSVAGSLGQTASTIGNIIKNPAFLMSFMQSAGNEYDNAKKNGANELQASLTGMVGGALNAGIERMGGIDTLVGNKAQGILKTALEEGGEEVLQDITSGLLHKATYDHGRDWYGTNDSDAIVNPHRLAMQATAGAVLGGAMGGVNKAVSHINQNTPKLEMPTARTQSTSQNSIQMPMARTNSNNIEVPTLRTVTENVGTTAPKTVPQTETVENIINNAINNAKNTQNADMQSEKPLQLNAVENAESMTSEKALQAPVKQLLASWQEVKALDKQIAEFEEKANFTGNDLRQIESSLLSGDTSTLYRADNPQDALYMVELKSKRNAAKQPIDEYKRQYQDKLWLEANQDAEVFFRYAKDKTFGLQYATETPERNIYDIFGKKFRAYAEDFIKRYYEPVHKAVAKGNKLKNQFRDRIRNLNLTHDESVLTQYLLEGKTEDYNQYISSNKIKLSNEQNIKISNAVVEFREIYDELFRMINDAEIRNGLEPTDFRQFYAPHFTEKLSDHVLARALNRVGFNITKKDQIPTSIAGITESFSPKKQWFKHLKQRTGEQTIVDAVRGFDQYIDTACDVITLTDSIQRFRQLENAIRYQHTDASMKKAVEKVMTDDTLSYLQRQQKLDEIYENNTSNAERINNLSGGNMGMRNFVAQLRKYTDNLAGKKSRGDRSIEDDTNRTVYEVSKQVQSRVSANMIAGNISSWLTNVIPLTQATGEIDLPDLFRGMRDAIKSYIKDDGFVAGSAFLTNRRGSKNILQTKIQKVGNALGSPMEFIDRLVSDTIVRARTHQNIKKGMDYNAAIDEADAMAASLMADRSKGATPEIFNRQNPITKVFTTFQIEVNNQLRYLGKDIPRRLGEQGGQAIAAALVNIFAGAFIYNNLYEKLTGRRAAFDPVGMIKDTLNIVNNNDIENSDKIQNTAKLYAQQLPFVGGLLGGGRLPISAVAPDFSNLSQVFNQNIAPQKRADILTSELANPAAYLLLPFGGGAIKKAVEGYDTEKNKGAYRINDEGEEQLMFASGDSAPDYLKSMLFGKYSSLNAQNYIDSGFKALSVDETKAYKQLVNRLNIDADTAYNAITAVRDATGMYIPKHNKRNAIMSANISADAKTVLEDLLIDSSDSRRIDYSDIGHFIITSEGNEKTYKNALYMYENMKTDYKTALEIANKCTITSSDNADDKDVQVYNALDFVNNTNVSDDVKNYAYEQILAPQVSKKFASDNGKKLLYGISVYDAIYAYYAKQSIQDDITNDSTIHYANKSEYNKIKFANYIDEISSDLGLNFQQKESFNYFLSAGNTEINRTWEDFAYTGSTNERENIDALINTGLDCLTYQVIKSGIGRLSADKDSNGKTISGSKKAKVIDYLHSWGVSDSQYIAIMQANGYNITTKTSKKSSSKTSKSSKSSSKVKGGFKNFSGF